MRVCAQVARRHLSQARLFEKTLSGLGPVNRRGTRSGIGQMIGKRPGRLYQERKGITRLLLVGVWRGVDCRAVFGERRLGATKLYGPGKKHKRNAWTNRR